MGLLKMLKQLTLLQAIACIYAQENFKCKSYYGLSELSNQMVENGFCLAEAGRTCCSPKDTAKIKLEIDNLRQYGGVSSQCQDLLTQS